MLIIVQQNLERAPVQIGNKLPVLIVEGLTPGFVYFDLHLCQRNSYSNYLLSLKSPTNEWLCNAALHKHLPKMVYNLELAQRGAHIKIGGIA